MAESEIDIGVEYARTRPLYEAFTSSVALLLETMIGAEEVEIFSLESRTKTIDSLNGKINREDKVGKYEHISDITDLCGIRLIAYLQEDCDKLSELVQRLFDVDAKNSVRKEDELDPDKFGYLSTHFVVSLPDARIALPEFARFAKLKMEIQVRTLLQHTWAAIDWKFRYKEERQAPKELRRRLFRISALLEAADNEFSAVKVAIDALAKEHTEKLVNNNLQIPIDTESLKSYMTTSATAQRVIDAARSAGIVVSPASRRSLLLGKLARTAELLGLETLDDIESSLLAFESKATEYFRYISDNRTMNDPNKPSQLVASAVIRYALIPTATKQRISSVLKNEPVSPGYSNTIRRFSEMLADSSSRNI